MAFLSKEKLETLQVQAEQLVDSLGYEIVAIEQNPKGATGKTLAVYIDFKDNSDFSRRISLQDCVTVNAILDELFENTPLLSESYSLEVSSPGVERPLRKLQDFARFQDRKVRIHTFRALSAEELGNEKYWETHKKQKNFIGTLNGLQGEGAEAKIRITVDQEAVGVPFELISKANLEYDPDFKPVSEPQEASVNYEPI